MKRSAVLSILFVPAVVVATVTCGGSSTNTDNGSFTIDPDGGKAGALGDGSTSDATLTGSGNDGSASSDDDGGGETTGPLDPRPDASGSSLDAGDDAANDAGDAASNPAPDASHAVCDPAPADGGLQLTYVTTIGPSGGTLSVEGLEIYGNRLYTTQQDHSGVISILDLSQPETLPTIGTVSPAGGTGRFVYDDGTYLYVGANYSGVELFSRADASAPLSTVTGTQAYGIAAAYPNAYTASAPGGGSAIWFQAIHYASPGSPTSTSLTWDAGGADNMGDRATAVTVNGAVAYVNFTVSDLRVVDITTPQTPTQIGSVALPAESPAYACYDRINRPLLDTGRNLLMVPRCRRGVSILDVSTPRTPRVLSSTDSPACETYDNYATLLGTRLITHNGTAIRIYDVQNASSPYVLGITTAHTTLNGDIRVGPDRQHVYIGGSAGVDVYKLPN